MTRRRRSRYRDEAMTRFTWLVLTVVIVELGLFLWLAGGIRPLG